MKDGVELMGFASVGDEMLFVLLVPDITGADTMSWGNAHVRRPSSAI